MPKKSILMLLISMFYANLAFSQLFDGKTQQETSLTALLTQVRPGTILFLGENHGLGAHRDQHMQVLNGLHAMGLKVSVGLEFINYTDQSFVELYRTGRMDEQEFLSAIKWGGFGFEYYKPQLTFPIVEIGEMSLGLNMPRIVTSKISKNGIGSLTSEDWKLMPPNFEVGRDSYKARFMEAAGAHCRVPENCFAAQSTWDDTMAWQAVNFIEAHPEQVLVIVVGEFHVQYGGGTPWRVKVRKPDVNIVTLSQVWAEGMTEDEIQQSLMPSELEGPRADFIWVSKP